LPSRISPLRHLGVGALVGCSGWVAEVWFADT
jgi:hypothetical protein